MADDKGMEKSPRDLQGAYSRTCHSPPLAANSQDECELCEPDGTYDWHASCACWPPRQEQERQRDGTKPRAQSDIYAAPADARQPITLLPAPKPGAIEPTPIGEDRKGAV